MKVVYTIHDIVSFENKKSNNRLSNWIYMKSDKILTHNSFSKKIFDNYFITQTWSRYYSMGIIFLFYIFKKIKTSQEIDCQFQKTELFYCFLE